MVLICRGWYSNILTARRECWWNYRFDVVVSRAMTATMSAADVTRMQAIVYTRYGPPDVLELRDVPRPAPKENEVLVRVAASSINAFEWRRFTMPSLLVRMMGGGLREPKDTAIGTDFAGIVEAAGAAVRRFTPGDHVYGLRRGAFAEYVCAAEEKTALKPANLSFEAAAAVPLAALTALQGFRDHGAIAPGQKVLIHGAGGGVGTFAVQIAKSFHTHVTAVCGPGSVDTVRAIGADQVIDYTQDDGLAGGRRYDVILAVNGSRGALEYRRALTASGTCVVIGGSAKQLLHGMFLAPMVLRFGTRKMRAMMTRGSAEDLAFLTRLIEAGKVVPVIDRVYLLRDVAEGMRYLMAGHSRGKVVLRVSPQ